MSYIAGRVESSSPKKNLLVLLIVRWMREKTGITFTRSTRGANVRTTCVGGSVLLSFTFAKSQSRPTPTASRPRHPSRPSSHPLCRPFVLPPGIVARAITFSLSLSPSLFFFFLSLFFSFYFPFSHMAESEFVLLLVVLTIPASTPRFVFLSPNNNVCDNFFRYILVLY